jgi:hypothetical protein
MTLPNPQAEIAMPRCFQVNAADNVATALDDLVPGEVRVLGVADSRGVLCTEDLSLGHKIALQPIPAGTPVLKYGVRIGTASQDIPPGAWVHLHNCHSQVDERSSHLDLKTGAAKDTVYA